jgi:DNA modification methylase
MTHAIIPGDCIEGMRTLPDEIVHCCVTSPPYWGLRDYGHDGQIGLEATPEAYVARMVEVFREVRRVLRDDGTCWVNLGDSYAAGGTGRRDTSGEYAERRAKVFGSGRGDGNGPKDYAQRAIPSGLKPKDLVGIPWRVAFALQADGWWLRQDIIWHKPNPMPESVRDRCTKAHEYVFMLTKSERYFYDAEAVSEVATVRDAKGIPYATRRVLDGKATIIGRQERTYDAKPTRNRRSVWRISTKPCRNAHFAVMPPDLVEPCIKAGCPEGGTVLDPFAGSGTTLAVAAELGRNGIGCELNLEYIAMAEERIKKAVGRRPLLEAFA